MLRLEIRAGEIAVRDSRLVRIETRLADGQVRVKDLATGEFNEIRIADLRARSSTANGASIDAHLEASRSSEEVPWQRAAAREEALAALFEGTRPWGERAQGIANARGISPPNFEETLTAAGFLQVLRDLSTFGVELWDVDTTHTVASSLDQHAALLTHHCSHQFSCRRPRRTSHLR